MDQGSAGHWYVQGDTGDEAIAFLAGAAHFAAEHWGTALLARALVVKTEDAWRSLERHALPLTLVRDFSGGGTHSRQVQQLRLAALTWPMLFSQLR